MKDILLILSAICLDWLLGDPKNFPHPIRWIGRMISAYERLFRRIKPLVLSGFLLLGASLVTTVGFVMLLAYFLPPTFFYWVKLYFLYAFLAGRSLSDAVYAVKNSGSLEEARKALSDIVGRDTENLDESGIIRGAVETAAENTVDGVLAPLIYMMIGSFFGLPLVFAVVYKTVNTLDSMVGYTHPDYKDIGMASARTDDVLNWMPARFGSLLMLFAGGMLGYDMRRGFSVRKRDHANHKSPNSGYPESTVAGLLGVQLGGTNSYFGVPMEKPTIGTEENKLTFGHIKDAIRILQGSEGLLTILYLVFSAGLKWGGWL
jgi:adenosylcobinamide-phosphate synthase